jgi:hypothetical protein
LIRARAEVLADRALKVWSYFGQEQSELDSLSQGVTGTTPTGLLILGQRFSVSTWREVAQITLETSHERDRERFEQVLAQFPRFVGHDPSRFRSSRQLANGLFFETNLSATSIHRLCVQISELSGMSSEDWRVEYAPSADRQPAENREKRADWADPFLYEFSAQSSSTGPEVGNTPSIEPSEIDTIVVPARGEGFHGVFLGENRWYAIRIQSSMKPKIRYIAVYQVAPVSAITHMAEVADIEPWKDTQKFCVNFKKPAQKIGPILLVSAGRVAAPQSIRYTSFARLQKAKSLDDVF